MKYSLVKRSRTEVYNDLGLPEARLPADYFSPDAKYVCIGQVQSGPDEWDEVWAEVYVMGRKEAWRASQSKGRKPHRVWCYCPMCGDEVPLSRINQHYNSAECRYNVKKG